RDTGRARVVRAGEAGHVGEVVADPLVACEAVAGAELDLDPVAQVGQERLIGDRPGEGPGGEDAVAVVRPETRRTVGPKARGEEVAIRDGEVRPREERDQVVRLRGCVVRGDDAGASR